jgi:two-component system sensor histidine kinase VicK
VGIGLDNSVVAARAGGARTLDLLGLSALVAFAALLLAMRAAQAEMELATRQSEFVTAVTHEMKTPLSSIVLTSDSLAQGRYASEHTVGEYGRIIGAEARQLTRLIDNVLHYARLINASPSAALERVDIVELVAESVERFGLHLSSAEIEVDLDLPLQSVTVRADRRLLQDALDNVIDNAVKHGGAGRHLRVAVRSGAARVVIEVADRGAGVPPEDLPRIFEKFYRGRNANERGSGLGLTIARRIVSEHAGTIHIRSTLGHGTLVEIELPAEATPPPA